jgi:putative colanic acid biosynthesis acetyltransferase WcaF
MKTDLSTYNNSWYNPGAGVLKRFVWYVVSRLFFKTGWPVPSGMKCKLLRMFGARIGSGVVIKPSVNIKYPWFLSIGNHVWIGERVWIDNLAMVTIGESACLSQGAMLLCGNHDYTEPSFDLMVGEINLAEGCWIGALALVGPGVKAGSHAVLSAGSVASGDLEPFKIYRGNPAVVVRERKMKGERV